MRGEQRIERSDAWACKAHGNDPKTCAQCAEKDARDKEVINESLRSVTNRSSHPPDGRRVSDIAPKRTAAQIEADRSRAEEGAEEFETEATELLAGVDENRLKNLMDAYGTQKKREPGIEAIILAFNAAKQDIVRNSKTAVGQIALQNMQRQGMYKFTLGQAIKKMPVQGRKNVLQALKALTPLSRGTEKKA